MNQQELMNAVRQLLTAFFSMLTIAVPTLAASQNFSLIETGIMTAVPSLCTLISIGWSVYAHWNMKKVPETAVAIDLNPAPEPPQPPDPKSLKIGTMINLPTGPARVIGVLALMFLVGCLVVSPANAAAVQWEEKAPSSGVIAGAHDRAAVLQKTKLDGGLHVRKLPPKGGFPNVVLPIPLPNPNTPTTTPTTPVKNGLDPITWLRSFSVADLQTALNQGLRIDMVCTSGTAADSNMLALTGCTGTPHAGDTLAAAGGATIISVGTFTAGAGSVVLSSAQTVAGVTVTAINPSLPVDIITTPCWTFLLGIVQGTVPSILPSSLGAATAIQTAFDDEARLTSWFAPGGMFDQFGLNCAPMVNKINVQVTAAGITIAAAVAGGPAASAAILPGIQAILGGAVAIALPKL